MSVTVGVIGCGSIARLHAPGLQDAQVRVKWVCDLSEKAAEPHAARFGATYAGDYRRVLDDPDVDAVDVLTISAAHKEICLAAIQAGKAVICEKTLAENADDALEIVQAAERSGTIFYTAYMKRFIPAVAKAKELLPALGKILSTYIRTYQPWGSVWEGNPAQGGFHTPPGGQSQVVRKYGGGILVCGGSHVLDLVCFLLGRPRRLLAMMDTPPDRDYDLQASALLGTDNGPCHYEALAHPLGRIGFLRDGWDERVEINGTRGRLDVYTSWWDQGDVKPSLLVHYDDATGQSTEYRYVAVSPFVPELAFFCRNIANGTQGAQPRSTGYDVDELIATIKRSAAAGQAVDVNWRI